MLRVRIKSLKEPEEFRESERLQKSIWGGLSVSAETMLVTQKFGGAVLGAFVSKRLVGFIYAFMARRGGRTIHWSHLMGVLPPFRSQGLGFRLKLAHRDLALRQGIRSICWTFDPLQSRNASLNLSRLGARVEEYVVDCYGRFPSKIERGLESDRFIVNWRIASESVERCLTTGKPEVRIPDAPRVNLTGRNDSRFLVNRKIDLGHNAPQLLVEIPADTDVMRAENLALAERWRFQTRKIFLHCLSTDYRVERFLTDDADPAGPRCFYLLRRRKS